MEDQDCYIFIDPEETKMNIMCVECHDTKMPDTGSYYQGSVEGYSPYDWICDLCGKYIHKEEKDKNDENICN